MRRGLIDELEPAPILVALAEGQPVLVVQATDDDCRRDAQFAGERLDRAQRDLTKLAFVAFGDQHARGKAIRLVLELRERSVFVSRFEPSTKMSFFR